MGLPIDTARFLLEARASGHHFGRVVTVGRSQLTVREGNLKRLCDRFGVPVPGGAMSHGVYADRFFVESLGAERVTALDASDYQDAGLVHDLNKPIPDEMEGRFDTLYDGGSLEHIFNVPVAVANYMRLIKPGGRLFLCIPANNQFGHGFYQFSSEFFYRVFDDANGFATRRVVIVERPPRQFGHGRRYAAPDPAEIGGRTVFVNAKPVLIMAEAEKLRAQPIFASFPVQSIYAQHWEGAEAPPSAPTTTPSLLKRVKKSLRRRLKARRERLGRSPHFPKIG